MASIRKEINVSNSPSAVWDALRDFHAVHERVAPGFLTASRPDGDDRVLTFFNGGVARERLVSADDRYRRLVYAVVESRLGALHHQGTVEVVDDTDDDGCRLIWTADVLPHEVADVVGPLMDRAAIAMEKALAAAT